MHNRSHSSEQWASKLLCVIIAGSLALWVAVVWGCHFVLFLSCSALAVALLSYALAETMDTSILRATALLVSK